MPRPTRREEECYKAIPSELEVCLSSECNLACRYCYSRRNPALSPLTLSWGELRAGLDHWLDLTAPERTAGLGTELSLARKVDFSGREPLLHWKLLDRAVTHLRRRAGETLEIGIFTNGTLLSREKLSRLLERGVRVAVSLDGPREMTDRNRVFRDEPGSSVFDAVAANLRSFTPAMRRKLTASPTYTAETVGRLPESVEFLLGLGFGDISIGLEMFERWSGGGRAVLRRALRALAGRYRESVFFGNWPHSDTRMFPVYSPDMRLRKLPRVTDEITLGYDGYYYPCTVPALGPASRRRHRMGSVRSGPDLRRLYREMERMDSVIGRHGVGECAQCPVGGTYDCLMRGKDVPGLLASARRVSGVFREELGGLFALDSALNSAALSPGFGDFSHRPRRVSTEEIAALTIKLDGGHGAAALSASDARRGADLALYSPGNAKALRFETGDAAAAGEKLTLLLAYSLMKADRLTKRLRLTVRAPAGPFPPELADLIRRHSVFLELIQGAGAPKKPPPGLPPDHVTAVLRSCGPAGGGGITFASLSRGGFGGMSVEPVAQAGADGFSRDPGRPALSGKKPFFIVNLDALAELRAAAGDCPRRRYLTLDAEGRYYFESSEGRPRAGSVRSGLSGPRGACVFSPSSPVCAECSGRALEAAGRRLASGTASALLRRIMSGRGRAAFLRGFAGRKKMFSGLFAGEKRGLA